MVLAVQFNDAIDSIIHYGQAKDVDIISVSSEPTEPSSLEITISNADISSTESGVKWDVVDTTGVPGPEETASNSSESAGGTGNVMAAVSIADGLVPPPNTPNSPDSAADTTRNVPIWALMEVSPNWNCHFQELLPADMVPANLLAPPMGPPPL